MIDLLAYRLRLVHNLSVSETSRTWFGDQTLQAGRAATFGGIFSSQAIAPSLGGVAGIPSGMPGTCSRFANPVIAAHPFGDGSGQPLLQEATIMAIYTRAFAQNLPFPEHVYLASVEAGISAARDWFRDIPTSLANYLDFARMAYVWDVIDSSELGTVSLAASLDGFTHGFERGVAEVIAEGASHD